MSYCTTGRLTVLGAVGALFAIAAIPATAATAIAQFVGIWRVTHVRVDEASGRRRAIVPDDARLVGRSLTVSSNAVTLGTLDSPATCNAPSLAEASTSISHLLGDEPTAEQDTGANPFPADYHLPFAPQEVVGIFWLSCKQGGIGPGYGVRGDTWIIHLPDNTLAMAYQDGSILLLARETHEKLQASFQCTKASGSSERAICNSLDLGNLDRSIADAYEADVRQFSKTGDPASAAKLKASQKIWLRVRDACGNDAGCLKKTMGERIAVLGNSKTFTGE